MINLSLMHPRLFTSLILIEPVLQKTPNGAAYAASYWIERKRDKWPSRDSAIAYDRRHPLHKTWDNRVFDIWKHVGYRDISEADKTTSHDALPSNSGGVTLVTGKDAELATFARSCHPKSIGSALSSFTPNWLEHPELMGFDQLTNPVYRPEAVATLAKLHCLRPNCLLVTTHGSPYWIASQEGRAEFIKTAGTGIGGSGGSSADNVKNIIISGGHFSPFVNPNGVAAAACPWIAGEIGRWHAQDLVEARERQEAIALGRSAAEVDPMMRLWIRKHYGEQFSTSKKGRKGNTTDVRAKL